LITVHKQMSGMTIHRHLAIHSYTPSSWTNDPVPSVTSLQYPLTPLPHEPTIVYNLWPLCLCGPLQPHFQRFIVESMTFHHLTPLWPKNSVQHFLWMNESRNPNSVVWQMMLKLSSSRTSKVQWLVFYFWLCWLFCRLLWSGFGELVSVMEWDLGYSIDNLYGECVSQFLEMIGVEL